MSEGTIQIGERVVNDVLAKDRNIAMVVQNYALNLRVAGYKKTAFSRILS